MAKFKNPILKGFYPDPSICRVGDDYYIVNSTFAYFPGVPIFHSKDLANFEQIGNVFTRESNLNLDKTRHSGGIYAPTLRYHDGTFYLITTNIPNYGNFIVTAKDIKGPWSDPYILEGAEGIDPSLFFDDDGKCYYVGTREKIVDSRYYGDNQIYVQELDLEKMQLVGEKHVVWCGALKNVVWPEGPHLYKKDGYYYLMIAEGGTDYEHCVTVARSKTIFGEYEGNPCNPILTHRNLGRSYPIKCVGHGDLVETQNGDWFMVMLGTRDCNGYCNTGRDTFLAKVTWQDGWPVVNEGYGKLKDEDETNLEEFKFSKKESCYHFYGDKFDDSMLFLRNPNKEMYSFEERKGFLRLYLSKDTIMDVSNPTFVGIRQTGYEYILSTMMEFKPSKDNEAAGLTILQNNEFNLRYEYIKKDNKNVLQVVQTKKLEDEVLVQVPVDTDRLFLKVIAKDQKVDFYYGVDGNNYSILKEDVDTSFLSKEIAGGFVGCTLGIYATSNKVDSNNYADFLYLNYQEL